MLYDLMTSFDRLLGDNSFFMPLEMIEKRYPSISLKDNADEYLVNAELPGLKKEDVKIVFQNGVLTLSGKKEKKVPEGKNHLSEIETYEFNRSIQVPYNVKEDEIKADFVDGILSVTLPKSDEHKPIVVKIN